MIIGKIFPSKVEFFDSSSGVVKIKSRPVLILSEPRNNDYTVLPISTITKRENLDFEYDVELNPDELPLIMLKKISYVRTHKRMTVHRASLDFSKELGDLKKDYNEKYIEIITKTELFNDEIRKNF